MRDYQGKQMLSMPRMAGMALLALVFAFAWPAQLGGKTSYMITHGTSMEPKFHAGDFVIARAGDQYKRGDVVLYRSAELKQLVLHRIVAQSNDIYTLKGDNNAFNDPSTIHHEAITGAYVAHVPLSDWRVGAALIVLCLLIVLAINRERSTIMPAFNRDMAVSACQALALACLVIILALPQMQTSAGKTPNLQSEGHLSYTGAARPGKTYPQGQVLSPQPVYTKLVDKLALSYAYQAPKGVSIVSSRTGLDVVVEDANGFQRTILVKPLADAGAGEKIYAAGQLDLRDLEQTLDGIRRETGLTATSYIVHVRPSIEARLRDGAREFDHSARPDIELRLTPSVMGPVKALDTMDTLSGTGSNGRKVVAVGPFSFSTQRGQLIMGLLAALFVAAASLARFVIDGDDTDEKEQLYGEDGEGDLVTLPGSASYMGVSYEDEAV